MAIDASDDNRRHVYGPRPLGALVPGITRPSYRRRAPAAAQVMSDWHSLVGPELAAVTLPRRLAGGTLTIACDGPMALELQHLTTMLIARINTALGRQTVERLRFVQDALPAPPPASAPPPADRPLPPAVTRALAELPEGPLRDALRGLGGAVHGTRPQTPRLTRR